MAPFDYLSERLDDQIKWYDRKSKNAKRWHFSMMVVQLVAATSIPVLAAAGAKPAYMALMGGISALAAALWGLGQWQPLWVRYRATAEALKHQRYMYLAQAGPYAGGQVQELVRRCESLISSEHAVWASLMERARVQPQQGGQHGHAQ